MCKFSQILAPSAIRSDNPSEILCAIAGSPFLKLKERKHTSEKLPVVVAAWLARSACHRQLWVRFLLPQIYFKENLSFCVRMKESRRMQPKLGCLNLVKHSLWVKKILSEKTRFLNGHKLGTLVVCGQWKRCNLIWYSNLGIFYVDPWICWPLRRG